MCVGFEDAVETVSDVMRWRVVRCNDVGTTMLDDLSYIVMQKLHLFQTHQCRPSAILLYGQPAT